MNTKQLRIYLFSFFLIFFSFFVSESTGQWDPNAGYIAPLTKGKTVIPSSGTNMFQVNDENSSTHWTSDSPLPTNYIARADQNTFLGQASTLCTYSAIGNITMVTDGSVVNSTNVTTDLSGSAWVKFTLPTAKDLLLSSMKFQGNADIEIYATTAAGTNLVGTYTVAENYSTKKITLPTDTYTELEFRSTSNFGIFEIAALEEHPREFCTIDLGTLQEVGHIHTKHWAGSGAASGGAIYLSTDNSNWTKVADINPETIGTIVNEVNPPIDARYIKVEHSVIPNDWNKVFIFEIAAYDRFNNFGPIPTANPSTQTLEETMGINGIWGWGHSSYSNLLNPGEGPDLYNTFSTHARNYHSMSWDVLDPDNAPDYVTMSNGGGTEAQWWLNWDQEYGAWIGSGLEVQASIFIKDFQGQWDTPYASAYTYGYNYAEHFGPTNGTGHITAIEVGNEPWFFDTLSYNAILRGMAEGAKAADPAMEVYPCALQAHDPSAELPTSFFHNYLGFRVKEDMAPYLDGINVHNYSYEILDDGNATRVAVHPEHYESGMKEIFNEIRFRDQNLPGKKIYVSEWGWDFPGPNSSCTHSECVSPQAAAVYSVRGALFYFRLGVDRMTWFFYGDDEDGGGASSLYTRSGATESADFNFTKKTSFYAAEALRLHLGDRYFLSVVKEDDEAVIYAFGDATGNITHYAGWRPIDGDDVSTANVSFTTPNLEPKSAIHIEGLDSIGTNVSLPSYNPMGSLITFSASTIPTIMEVSPVLPVELIEFKGNCNNGKTALQWTTATEENNSHFEVYRKDTENNSPWEKIGRVEGNGNSSAVIHYSFIDQAPFYKNAYQLKQIDFNGAYEYSEIIAVDQCVQNTLGVYPNPTKTNVNIKYSSIIDGEAHLKLFDAKGVLILEKKEIVSFGNNTIYLSMENMIKGSYVLEVHSKGNLTKKIIVLQ